MSRLEQVEVFNSYHQGTRSEYEALMYSDPIGQHRIFSKTKRLRPEFAIIAIVALLLTSFVCLHWITSKCNEHPQKAKLKLVNIFSRHGDRAPSGDLPQGDRHIEKVDFFWPNGLKNLTEIGKLRMFRVGLATRKHYEDYIGFDTNEILAFSSSYHRCQESLDFFLKGFYNIERTKSKALAANYSNLPTGEGGADDWRRVKVDLYTVKSLGSSYLDNCKYRLEHPSPIDADLMNAVRVKSIASIDQVKETITKRYNVTFSQTALEIWSTVACEMELVHTQRTYEFTKHYRDWYNKLVYNNGVCKLTLLDVLEEVTFIAYLDNTIGTANYIQTGPLVTSIVESQKVAMNFPVPNDRFNLYDGKKMLLYSTHDTVIQLLLQYLDLIRMDAPYETRCKKHANDSQLGKFLAGLKMANYGISLRFELMELEHESIQELKISYVQLSIYNQEDSNLELIKYEPVELGSACRRIFKRRYPKAKDELNNFYSPDLQIDKRFHCPFELFLNVTSNMMIGDDKLDQLCT